MVVPATMLKRAVKTTRTRMTTPTWRAATKTTMRTNRRRRRV